MTPKLAPNESAKDQICTELLNTMHYSAGSLYSESYQIRLATRNVSQHPPFTVFCMSTPKKEVWLGLLGGGGGGPLTPARPTPNSGKPSIVCTRLTQRLPSRAIDVCPSRRGFDWNVAILPVSGSSLVISQLVNKSWLFGSPFRALRTQQRNPLLTVSLPLLPDCPLLGCRPSSASKSRRGSWWIQMAQGSWTRWSQWRVSNTTG